MDGRNNLYVQNGLSIAVIGPNDSGRVVPARVISGPHTKLGAPGTMTTDEQGNLYVATSGDAFGTVAVLEFASDANGDAMPLRSVSSTQMSNFDGVVGVAVDPSGQIFVRATAP